MPRGDLMVNEQDVKSQRNNVHILWAYPLEVFSNGLKIVRRWMYFHRYVVDRAIHQCTRLPIRTMNIALQVINTIHNTCIPGLYKVRERIIHCNEKQPLSAPPYSQSRQQTRHYYIRNPQRSRLVFRSQIFEPGSLKPSITQPTQDQRTLVVSDDSSLLVFEEGLSRTTSRHSFSSPSRRGRKAGRFSVYQNRPTDQG